MQQKERCKCPRGCKILSTAKSFLREMRYHKWHAPKEYLFFCETGKGENIHGMNDLKADGN